MAATNISVEEASCVIALQAQSIAALEIAIGHKIARVRALEENGRQLAEDVLAFVDEWRKWVESPESMPSTPMLKTVEALEAYADKIRD